MSGKRIKGITVEIDGSTTGLDKALKGLDSSINETEMSLKDINRLLKIDPKNTELLAQKQKILSSEIENTSKRLEALKNASEDAAKSVSHYDEWKTAFDPIQNEINQTKDYMKELRAQMADMKEVGEVDTDGYKKLQAELKETNSKLKNLQQQAKDVSAEFGNPINPAQYDALQREIIDTEQKLSRLQTESETTSSALKGDFQNAAKGANTLKESVNDIGESVKSGVFMEAADQISSVGDKLSELGGSAIESFNGVNDAGKKAAAYFGETGKAAESTAAVIKDVYEGGVGDSMDSVSNAVIDVKKNLGDLDQVTLTNLTNQAITLEDLYGIDMNETMRGVASLMKNFGLTAQEAMDYVVTGTQNGLDKTDELGDNLSEYSGKFSQAGYSAQDYFQLLNNGLDGGAYNLDKVNDAINEVTTRLADGTIGDNIGMYSDKTKELFEKWQNGGATQKEVIDSIVSDISNTTNQQDALNMAAQAFGTMAEDGNLKFITSLTSVGDSYDDVSGKAQGMFDATSTPSQEMESNMRKLKDSLVPLGEKASEIANTIIPPLASGITTIAQGFGSLPAPVQVTVSALVVLIAGIAKIVPLLAALKALGLPAVLSGIGTAITGTVLPAIASGISAFAGFLVPILPIVAAISAVIAISVLLYKNWDTVKKKATVIWNAINKVISNAVNGIKSSISTALNAAMNIVSGVFDSIKNTISKKINGAKDAVKSAIDKIKSFFKFSWSLPKLKLPHVKISGKFSLDPPSVPKFGISWYNKAMDKAMVMTRPTVFGYDAKTNQLLAGGETGNEILTGERHLTDLINGVFQSQNGQLVNLLDQLISTVQTYFPQVIDEMEKDIVLDDGTLVGKMAGKMNENLRRQQIKEQRGIV
jgi:phage-related minor tail protein